MITNEQIAELQDTGYAVFKDYDEDMNRIFCGKNKSVGLHSPIQYSADEAWAYNWRHYQQNLTAEELARLNDNGREIMEQRNHLGNGISYLLKELDYGFLELVAYPKSSYFSTPRLAYRHFLTTIDNGKV
jgi:hypothetical protein